MNIFLSDELCGVAF